MSSMFTYRLAGFSNDLDWRSTAFEERFPANRVCSLCGTIPKKIALLPCCHLLCESCHGECVNRGNPCPLDRDEFQTEFVAWLEFPEEQLAKRKVFCWNAGSGCEFVGPIAAAQDHYQKECRFHLITCPRCRESVLQRDIVEHYCAGCSPVSGGDSCTDAKDHSSLQNIGQAVEEVSDVHACLQSTANELIEIVKMECSMLRESCADELRQLHKLVTELSGSLTKHMTSLNEALTGVSSNTEKVAKTAVDLSCGQKHLRQLVAGLNKSLTTDMVAVSSKLSQVSLTTENVTQNASLLFCRNTLHWYVNNWDKFKLEKSDESSKICMYGYNLSCIAQLSQHGTQVKMSCYLIINSGKNDSTLEWHFRKVCILNVIHPKVESKTISRTLDAVKQLEARAFARPFKAPIRSLRFPDISTVKELESGGFIEKNMLHLCLQVGP